LSNGGQSFYNHGFIQVMRHFHVKNTILSKDFRDANRFWGDSQFSGNLGQLFLNLGASLDCSGIFHDQVNPFIHSTSVHGKFIALTCPALGIQQSILRKSCGNKAFRTLNPGNFLVNNHLQVINQFSKVKILRV